MKIEILGSGCKRCDQLYQNSLSAISEIDASRGIEVVKVKDVNYFAQKGVLMTPGLIINDDLISTGKVLTAAEIKKKIEEKL